MCLECGCLKWRRGKEDLGKRVRGQEVGEDVERQGAMAETDQGIKTVEDMWFGHKRSR